MLAKQGLLFNKNRRPTKISPFHMIADTQASEDSFCEKPHSVSVNSLAIHQVILQVSCRLFALLALEKSTFTLLNLLLVTARIRAPGQILVSRFTGLVRFLGLVHIVHQSELSDAKQTRHPYVDTATRYPLDPYAGTHTIRSSPDRLHCSEKRDAPHSSVMPWLAAEWMKDQHAMAQVTPLV